MSDDNGHHGEKVIEEIRSLVIPPGWARASVGEVGDVRLGRQRSPKNRSAEFPTKYVRAANITWNGLDLSDVLDMDFRPSELASYRLQPGDVLLSEASGSAGEVGKPAIWNGELEDCCFQNTVIRFRPKVVSSKFALVAFLHFARNSVFAGVSKGVGIHHLSADRFASMPFLLPPKDEQSRIVAKIEELFSDLDAGVAALKRAKANLKRYRASVLKAAVEGKLTEEWRTRHPATEPASALLARILKERRQKWEADQLAKFAAANKEPPKNWREKYVEPTHETGLFELPKSWTWASALEICEQVENGNTPPAHEMFEQVGDVPFIKVYNLTKNGSLDFSINPTFVSRKTHNTLLRRSRILPNDVLMNIVGPPLGKVSVVTDEYPEWNTNQAVVQFRARSGVLPRFLAACLMCDDVLLWIIRTARATAGQYNISVGNSRLLPLPLPPAKEQAAIVEILDESLSQIAAAETIIEHGLFRASRLRQSILKQAFEGKLVPQDPTDEPASILLERIRAIRSVHERNGKAATQNRTRGRRTKSKQLEGGATNECR
jgi:type I restriction enzyme S subunit